MLAVSIFLGQQNQAVNMLCHMAVKVMGEKALEDEVRSVLVLYEISRAYSTFSFKCSFIVQYTEENNVYVLGM